MRKRETCTKLAIVFLITAIFLSLITGPANVRAGAALPVVLASRESSKPTTTSSMEDILSMTLTEHVAIQEDGFTETAIVIDVPASALGDAYRRSLGVTADFPVGQETAIPDNITLSTLSEMGRQMTGSVIPVKAEFYKSVENQQETSLGLITNISTSSIVPRSSSGGCIIALNATGIIPMTTTLQSDSTYECGVSVRPISAAAIAGSVLSSLEMAQILLQSLPGEQSYECSWSTIINLPLGAVLLDTQDLSKLEWNINLGGGARIDAWVTVEDTSIVVINENTVVTEHPILVSPQYLYAAFSQYKTLNIKYQLPRPASSSLDEYNKEKGFDAESGDTWSYTWSIPWSKTNSASFTYGPLSAELTATASLSLSGYIGWDFDLLQGLTNFESWINLTASIQVHFEASASASYSHGWEQSLFESQTEYYFTVGLVPVWADLTISGTGVLSVSAYGQLTVTAQATVSGSIKAGVRWTKSGGWAPLSEVNTNADHSGPDLQAKAGVSVRPGVQFRIAFLFYDVAGPFIEFEPYAQATVTCTYPPPHGEWEVTANLQITAGATFAGWLKDLLGLDDWSVQLYDIQLMRWSGSWGASTISITETLNPSTSPPNGSVLVSGTATLNDGSPVSYTDVIATVSGMSWTTTTDGAGGYSLFISAPTSDGSYTVQVCVNTGSLSGSTSQTLTVHTEDQNVGTISLSGVTTCKDFDQSYDPIDETDVFRRTDVRSCVWVYLTGMITNTHTVKYEWYEPSGYYYAQTTVTIDPASHGDPYWTWAKCLGWIYIAGNAAQFSEGRWNCRVYIDGQFKTTVEFVIGYEVIDRTMAQNVQTSYPYEPIGRTNSFPNTDSKTWAWIRLDNVAESLNIKWDWFDPTGTLYGEYTNSTGNPSTYWLWYKAWCWIAINGFPPQSKLGLWQVKAYIQNVDGTWSLEYSQYFVISDNTPPGTPGTPSDGGVYSTTGTVTWTWAAASEDGAVIQYEIQIGTTLGGNDVFDGYVASLSMTLDNLPSGKTYYARVRAMNTVGQWGPWSANSDGITVDRPPITILVDGPAGTINYGDVLFTWIGSDDVTPQANIVYSYCLEGKDAGWSPWLSTTSIQYNNLPDGTYEFLVKAKDQRGTEDPTPANTTFTVSRTQLGWSFQSRDLARTAYYPPATQYTIPNQPFGILWSSPHKGKNLMALIGDVDGDGKLEIVKVNADNLTVISGSGMELWTRNIPGVDSRYGTGYLNLNLLEDVTGDNVPEIFVSRKTSDTTGVIYVYDGSGNLLKTLTRTLGSDGNMWAVAVFDVNKDDSKEVFCGIGSNYVGNPRGTCLFDYNTGNELWYYAAGNSIADCVADLNNDGKMEITSTWWTVHNGAAGSGKGGNTYTSDSSVYVVVVNENGSEIFTWQVHDAHTHGGALERITDLNRDGTKEVVVFHGHDPSYAGYAQIFLLSSTGTVLETFTGSYNTNWYQPAIADVNNDGKDEIIVGCSDGVLRVLDYNLNVIASSNHYYAPQAITDLNGDGKLEIIVSDYRTHELVVLDNNLNVLWKLSFPVTPSAIVSDVNGDGVNDLIITADKLYVASYCTLGSIGGRVTDAISGSGIEGASVSVSGLNSGSATTDSNGYYTVANLPPSDSYSVSVSGLGYTSQTKSATVKPGETTTIDFQLQSVQCTLTVISDHDSPNPGNGAHTYDNGNSVTCNVSSPVTESSTVWTCIGWTGTGSVPSSGSGTSVTFTIVENSSIIWNWQGTSIQHQLTISVVGSGTTNPVPGTYQYPNGTNVNVTAIESDQNWRFDHWELDDNNVGNNNPYTVTTNSDHSLKAIFVQKEPTVITFTLTPSPVYVGQTVTLQGLLRDEYNNPLNNTQVNVYSNGTLIAHLQTNSTGGFKVTGTPMSTGTYVVKVSFNGSSTLKPSSYTQTLTVLKKVSTTVSFTLSPNPAKKGQTITLSGNLTEQNGNPISGASVDISYSINNGVTWIYAGTLQTNTLGRFTAQGKLTTTGTFLVKVSYKGNSKYNPSSHIETLTINA